MADRGIWEEQLWTSDVPLPKRAMADDHPMRGLPWQYIADGQPLTPWALLALAPVPREWEPLPEHHEAGYLTPTGRQVVRVGLIDYSEGTVVDWRRTAGSRPYQSRQPSSPEGTQVS